jgi:hypothetical protein
VERRSLMPASPDLNLDPIVTVRLRCGHEVTGVAMVSNPHKWWCDVCRTLSERKT